MKQNDSKLHLLKHIIPTLNVYYETGKVALENPQLRKMMKEESFDLLIINFFMQDFLVGIGEHFKCPVMMVSPTISLSNLNRLFGNPMEISAVSFPMLNNKTNLNFVDRLLNFAAYGLDQVFHVYTYYKQREIYE